MNSEMKCGVLDSEELIFCDCGNVALYRCHCEVTNCGFSIESFFKNFCCKHAKIKPGSFIYRYTSEKAQKQIHRIYKRVCGGMDNGSKKAAVENVIN